MNPLRKAGIVAGLLASLWANPIQARTLHVPSEYTTIQAGINAAADGDSVLVASGTYQGSLTINKYICLKSESGAETTFLTNYSGSVVCSYSRNSAILEGFTISGAVSGVGGGAGVTIGTYETQFCDLYVKNNVIENNNTGISIGYRSSTQIEKNKIRNNSGNGIEDGGYRGIQISGNVIQNNGQTGIATGSMNDVSSNTIYGNRIGILIDMNNPSGSVHNNIITKNEIGIKANDSRSTGCNDFFDNGSNCRELTSGYPCQLNPKDIFEDPQFCDATNGNFYLEGNSPCANTPNCGVIGAFDIGCGPTAVKKTTWGQLKAIYR